MDLNPHNNSSQSAKQNTQIDGLRKKDQNKEVGGKIPFPFIAINKITKKKKWKSRPEYMTM